MQKINNILTKLAAATLAVILAAGCVFEKENPAVTDKVQNVLVQIGVNTEGMIETKADMSEAGNESPLATLETKVNTLRVYAYVSGVLSGYLYAENVDTENHALLMDVKLPKSGTATVDFVAVANEGGMAVPEGVNLDYTVGRAADGSLVLTGNAGQEELNKITYSVADQTFAKGMPMYAVGQATLNVNNVGERNEDTEGHEGHFILNDKINITLTRSLSKIAVYAAEEGTSEKNNVKINSVKISNVISSGNLFPDQTLPTATQAEATISNTEVTVTKKLNREAEDFSTKRLDPANFTLVTTSPYYIPENGAGNTGASYIWNQEVTGATKLTVNYTTGSGAAKDAVIYMPKIERNNFYKVLCLIKANGELELTLNVVDWELGIGAKIDFKDNVAFDEYFKWTKDGVDQTLTDETYTLGSAAGESVTFSFRITAPAGGKWFATLSGGDVQNYSLLSTTGNIGEECSITITTLYSNYNSGSDKEVKLTITAVKDGKSKVVHFNTQGYYTIKQNQML